MSNESHEKRSAADAIPGFASKTVWDHDLFPTGTLPAVFVMVSEVMAGNNPARLLEAFADNMLKEQGLLTEGEKATYKVDLDNYGADSVLPDGRQIRFVVFAQEKYFQDWKTGEGSLQPASSVTDPRSHLFSRWHARAEWM